jgi:hypothetical protein
MKVVKFRLYFEPHSSMYAEVLIHENQKALLEFGKQYGIEMGETCQATCTGFDVYKIPKGGGKPRKRPLVCQINLHRERLTMRVVTHELMHATIQWARYRKLLTPSLAAGDMDLEERICYAHGDICSQFTDRAYKAKLYDGSQYAKKEATLDANSGGQSKNVTRSPKIMARQKAR